MGTAKTHVRIMFRGIALRAKRRAQPIGAVDIRAAPLDLRGTLGRTMGIDGGHRPVDGFVVSVGHPLIEIASQVAPYGLIPLS